MTSWRRLWWVGAGYLALGCGGSAVDLGARGASGFTDQPIESATAEVPQTIYEGDSRIFGFGADDATLYALLQSLDDAGRLVSCPIGRCRSELTLLASGFIPPNAYMNDTKLESLGDWLYWIHGNGQPALGIAACPKRGCERVELIESSIRGELGSDGTDVYWVDDLESALFRWHPGGAAERVVALRHDEGWSLAVGAEHVYFVDREGQHVSQVRKDGSGTVEVVAYAERISSVGLGDDGIYFSSQLLSGALLHCPFEGCDGRARVVKANERWPSALKLDRAEAFWINYLPAPASGPARGTLLSCPLPRCENLRTWRGDFPLLEGSSSSVPPALRNGFVTTRRFVWWLEGNGGLGSALRRLPR